jgi:DNA invertase Pin-like site-specific DNA recombinase
VDLSGQRWNFSQGLQQLAAELDQILHRQPRVTPPVPRRKVRLTPAELSELVADYQSGLTMRGVATRWGLNRHTVAGYLRRSGIELRRQGLSDFQIAEAKRLYLSGWSVARLAAHFDCYGTTVWRELKKAGVQLRRPWERL